MLSSHQFCDKTPGGSSCHHFCSPVSVFNPAAILMPPVCTQLFWCHPSLYKVHTTFLPSCTGFSTDYLSLLPPSHVISCHSSLSCPYSTFPSRWVQCTLVLCAHPFCLEILFFFSRSLQGWSTHLIWQVSASITHSLLSHKASLLAEWW